MLLHAGTTNRESKALGSRNLTGTRQRMSLPLLAHLTGGIPQAEFSWVRAAAPRAKTQQQTQSFKESVVFTNHEQSHPLLRPSCPDQSTLASSERSQKRVGNPSPPKEASRPMAHIASTRQVLLHKNSPRALPEPAHIEELDGELGMSKSAHSPLMARCSEF